MKLAIMQPYFFPYFGYFQLINSVEKFIIYDDVQYIKNGWINRNKILSSNKEHIITVPLTDSSSNKLIKDIAIVPSQMWRIKLVKTIEHSYRKSPFYEDVFPLLKEILFSEVNHISNLNTNSIIRINEYLGIQTEIIKSSEIYKNEQLKGQSRIIDICLKEKANHYINPIGGMNLYEKNKFKIENIDLSFIKTNLTEYAQFGNTFMPSLSIIDVMMFNSKESVQKELSNFELL
jgi:hypothetical protein